MKPITTTETVRYTFTRDEKVGIAEDLARCHTDLQTIEEELANIKADYKAKTTAKDAELSQHKNKITSGYEMRQVNCLVLKFRPDEKSKLVVRLDTGVTRKDKLTEGETQMVLTTEEPEPYAFEADFFGEDRGGVQDLIAYHVPLTAKESELLREVVTVRPLRNLIEQ